MTREFIMTTVFDKLWKGLGLNDDDLRDFQNILMKNPSAGVVIQGSGGAKKIRFALFNDGKSGGIRVIYFEMTHLQQVFLLLCYQKSHQDDLTSEQKKQIKKLLEALKGV